MVVVSFANEIALLVCVEWNIIRRTGMRRVGVGEDEERGENCSVTLSADVCTARVCTAMGGFRPLHEGILQEGVCGRAGPRCECGSMVFGGHGYVPTAGQGELSKSGAPPLRVERRFA